MAVLATRTGLIVGLLLCVSCDGPAVQRSQSLVGAQGLPPRISLAEETIEITRTARSLSPYGIRLLSYELAPDNRLTVSHITRGDQNDAVLGRETFQLSADQGEKMRGLLWRLRPAHLQRMMISPWCDRSAVIAQDRTREAR